MMLPLKFIQAASAALLFFSALGVSAAPTPGRSSLHLSKRDVWSPPVITPDSTTVWTVGEQVTVTWYVDHNHQPRTCPVGAARWQRRFGGEPLSMVAHFFFVACV